MTFRIGSRAIGPDRPMYIIAEISGNHGGDLATARRLVKAAAATGVDAVKLQTYTADSLTIDADTPPFRIGEGTLWSGQTLHALYEDAYTPWEWHETLFKDARNAGVQVFSSPFDEAAIELLEDLGAPAYKIASFELVDHGLIAAAAATGKPLILSTGLSSADEITEAVAAARAAGCRQLALLRCNSAYPAPLEEMDLATIPDMAARWNVPVGLSDHSLGPVAPLAARALGACILEKHICLARDAPGPDAAFSTEPQEFADLVADIRRLESAIGTIRYGPSAHERASLAFRRSLFVVADVAKGEAFTPQNVRSIRPGHGLPPKRLAEVLQRTAARDLPRGTPLGEGDLA